MMPGRAPHCQPIPASASRGVGAPVSGLSANCVPGIGAAEQQVGVIGLDGKQRFGIVRVMAHVVQVVAGVDQQGEHVGIAGIALVQVFQDEPGFAGVPVVQELVRLLQAEVQELAGYS